MRLETSRLVMREWEERDREPFARMGQDPEVMRHFPSLLGREESDRMIDCRLAPHFAKHGFGFWAVERKTDGEFLGFTGLAVVEFACPIQDQVEIGWRLARHAWGCGYGLEAARCALDHAFSTMALERVFAMTIERNDRSRRLMERLGMQRRPDLDFDHPRVPPGHPTRPQIVYSLEKARLGG